VHVPLAPESKCVADQIIGSGHPRIAVDVSADSAPSDFTAWLGPSLGRIAFAFVGGASSHLEPLMVLSRRSPVRFVLTAGAAGAWGIARGRVVAQPTLARTIVDTTGCGDAFQGGFLVSAVSGSSLEDALAAGARAAAVVAAKRGGGPE
jgi:sugar/nucleoside kinase (ribokinase family)